MRKEGWPHPSEVENGKGGVEVLKGGHRDPDVSDTAELEQLCLDSETDEIVRRMIRKSIAECRCVEAM